jgi:hypothetical protein
LFLPPPAKTAEILMPNTKSTTKTQAPSSTQSKKSWRDVEESPDELRALGEDIAKRGLASLITLWSPGLPTDKNKPVYLLDGRNRLDALELMGFCLVTEDGKLDKSQIHTSELYGLEGHELQKLGVDPYAYVISANIHRRHLTPELKAQADRGRDQGRSYQIGPSDPGPDEEQPHHGPPDQERVGGDRRVSIY